MLGRPSEGLNHVHAAHGARLAHFSLPLLVALIPTASSNGPAVPSRFLARAHVQESHETSGDRGSALQTSVAEDSIGEHAVRHVTLRDHQAKTPGYYRSEGVRGGVPKAALGNLGFGFNSDSMLDSNGVTGDSMSYQFRVLDDFDPMAPMDRIETPLAANTLTGNFLSPLYVPGYLKPDSFPVKSNFSCNCQARDPKDPNSRDVCTCSGENAKDVPHFHYAKSTPIAGTRNYTLTAADTTFSKGDYWYPKIHGGIVAPKDRMPTDRYPNQATGDEVSPLPAQAREDRVALKYARYIDQVAARSEECDTVSPQCTVPCRPGDQVTAELGNMMIASVIQRTMVGNSALIDFQPAAAAGFKGALAECPLQAACSNSRMCFDPSQKTCQMMSEWNSREWNGDLRIGFKCPDGTSPCRTVSMIVLASNLRKDGKACKAAPEKV